MAKIFTFPTLYDDALQISITKLKEWNYLEPNQILNGTISWTRNDYKRASISIKSNTKHEQPYIELEYTFHDESRNYKVNLVCIPSNLGKGFIWYFLCPKTNKRCRKLYSVNGIFLHREAFKNCMYETQTYSKKNRTSNKMFIAYYKAEKMQSEQYNKNFKKMYAGKKTKRFLRVLKAYELMDKITYQEIENCYLKQ